MKVKVSEAANLQLDWMAAKCEGYLDAEMTYPNGSTTMVVVIDELGRPFDMRFGVAWRPSEKWRQGGPLIEREGILLRPLRSPGHTMDGLWLAMFDGTNTGTIVQWVKRTDWHRHYWSGPTPLVAAMRCFVASKLGDEVEVPDELN